MGLGIMVVTHGSAGIEMVKSAEMILGKQENISAISFQEGESVDDLAQSIQEGIKNFKDVDQILALVDFQGGSPFNVVMSMKDDFLHVICGINIPLLMELIQGQDNKDIEDMIENAIQTGRDGILSLSSLEIKKEDEEF